MGIPKFPALRGWHSSPDDGRISKKELEEVLSSQEARNERIFSGNGGYGLRWRIGGFEAHQKKSAILVGENLEI
jgi:hypothetical protein